MPNRRPSNTQAEADRRKAVAASRKAVDESQQLIVETAPGRTAPTPPGRPPVILQLGPRDFSVLAWVGDEKGTPVYRVVKDRIRAASTAAMLARKLQMQHARP